MRIVTLYMLLGLFVLSGNLYAQEVEFSGQLSGWTIAIRDRGDWQNQSGVRYLPQFGVTQPLNDLSFLGIEVGANGFAAYDSAAAKWERELELYRLTFRLATAQTETQIGLQKINFGPAQLLRSLRWFDRLDPRDPLQMTEGVYALRFKYTALNNANLWLWGVYGNDDPKGYELLPSVKEKPEFGGRLQYPLWGGEAAITAHTRSVDASSLHGANFREQRFALDGRWEVQVGFWFEAVLQQQETARVPYEWTKMVTFGIDYTFGVGNGVYMVAEHFATALAEEAFGWNEDTQMSAVSFSYPVGLFDSFRAISYYAWEQQELSQHLSWQRAYDNLVISASLFRYPESEAATLPSQQNAFGRGYGGQLMVIYYY